MRKQNFRTLIEITNMLQQIADRGEYITYSDAALECERNLGYPVSVSTVQTLLHQNAIQNWPKRAVAEPPDPTMKTRVEALERDLAEFSAFLDRFTAEIARAEGSLKARTESLEQKVEELRRGRLLLAGG